MAKNVIEIPGTELVERVRQIARAEASNDASRAWGAVNLAYTRDIPREEDWNFLLATSAVITTAQYKVGNATATTQNATVTFSSDVVLTASFTGRRIKFSANPNVYDVTFSNTTAITITPALSGDQNITNGAYVIFQPHYALMEGFDRFPKDKGLEAWQGGDRPDDVRAVPDHDFKTRYTSSPALPQVCRLVTRGTDNLQYVELSPPPDKVYNLSYECIRRLLPLRETTAGNVSITNDSTAVTGSVGVTRFSHIGTGAFLRVDGDGTGEASEWYRTLAVAHNSALTLQQAYSGGTNTTAAYTLSTVPLIPAKLHDAILYQAVKLLTADQNDPLFQYYDLQYKRVIADAKRLYKSRAYNQEVETVLEEFQFRR